MDQPEGLQKQLLLLTPECRRWVLEQAAEIERLRAFRDELLEQLRQQTKSFCTHCGTLFPKGTAGLAEFRSHIATCSGHPLQKQFAEAAREVKHERGR